MIRLIAVGRVKDPHLSHLTSEYLRRLRPLAPCEVVELKDQDPEREGREMVRRLGGEASATYVVAMDEHGDDVTSADMARLLGAHGSVAFLVGGADGLGAAVRERADRVMRLSSLTLTHEWARALLVEQIYRGVTIMRGMPYHRA